MVRGDEVAKVLGFVAVVGATYLAAGVVLLRRWRQPTPKPPLGRFARVVLAAAGAGVLCFLYGRFIEPRWLEVTETRVPTTRLPPGHRGVRIVHLSDLHSVDAPLLEDKLHEVVAPLKPDLIVFTGDCANAPDGVPTFRTCLIDLARIAPTFVVKGNWDTWFFPEVERFAGTGATELDSTVGTVSVAGAPVRIVGGGFRSAFEGLGPVFAKLPADGPAVVLYHCPYPDVVPPEFASRVDLMCAGHVHGGQVALPFYGALLTFSRYGKKYERGLCATDEGFPMYVTRGVGMEGGVAPRVRFCSRPEVSLIELVPAAK